MPKGAEYVDQLLSIVFMYGDPYVQVSDRAVIAMINNGITADNQILNLVIV